MSSITRHAIIFRSLPFSYDARTARHELVFRNEYVVDFVCWGSSKGERGYSSFSLPRKRGAFAYMALGYISFSIYLVYFVLRFVRKSDICIFMDLETAFPALLLSKWMGAQAIFDIVDPFFLVKPVRPRLFFRWLEEFVANNASLVFIPNEMRRAPYAGQLRQAKVLVVENVPSFMGSRPAAASKSDKSSESPITLGYFGGLEAKHRGLEDVVMLVTEDPRLRLIIGGWGELADAMNSASKMCKRIEFVGPFDYNNLPMLVARVDILVGLYYQTRELHRYASPNKYYEHFYFGKALLTSALTPFSGAIENLDSGWVVQDGTEHLRNWAKSLTSKEIVRKGCHAADVWAKTYQNYYQLIRAKILPIVGRNR